MQAQGGQEALQSQILQTNYGFTQQQQQQQAALNRLQGTQLGQQSAYNTLMNQLAGTGFGLQQQQLNLSERQAQQGMAGAGTLGTGTAAETAQQFGIQQGQLYLSEAQQKAQFGYSQQQVQDGYTALGIANKQLGISEAQAAAQYHNAMKQLGLSDQMTSAEFLQQLAAMVGGGYSPLAGQLQQMVQYIPGLAGALSSGQIPTVQGQGGGG
jgi:hypothetical protein